MSEAETLRTAALIAAAALRDDDAHVRLLAANVSAARHADVLAASVTSMAALLRTYLSTEIVQHAIVRTQRLAHESAQEGPQT